MSLITGLRRMDLEPLSDTLRRPGVGLAGDGAGQFESVRQRRSGKPSGLGFRRGGRVEPTGLADAVDDIVIAHQPSITTGGCRCKSKGANHVSPVPESGSPFPLDGVTMSQKAPWASSQDGRFAIWMA